MDGVSLLSDRRYGVEWLQAKQELFIEAKGNADK